MNHADQAPAHPGLLLVEDDPTFARVLSRALQARGHAVQWADSATRCLELLAGGLRPARVVLDLNLAGASGLALIAPLRAASPEVVIVVLTGYASIATAVEAIKLGASQYLAKPVETAALLRALDPPAEPGAAAAGGSDPPDEALSVSRLEWEHIQRVLAEHEGNVSATARALKMHRRTLQRKLGKRPVGA
jgi:two-component system response regulator RegA